MFETTLTADPTDSDRNRNGAVAAAVGAHVAVVAVLAVVSAITVPQIIEPPLPTEIHFVLWPSDLLTPRMAPAPPPPKKGAREPERVTAQPVAPQPVKPPADLAPTQTPDTTVAPPATGETGEIGDPDGEGSGSRNGVKGGVGLGNGPGDDEIGDTAPVALRPDMVPPMLIRRVEPVYPMAARLARLTGRVVIQAVIGTDGSVESVEVLSSTNPLFDDAAREAVQRWSYSPASMGGRPVRVYFTVVVTFVIR